jgi:hypothetical protein
MKRTHESLKRSSRVVRRAAVFLLSGMVVSMGIGMGVSWMRSAGWPPSLFDFETGTLRELARQSQGAVWIGDDKYGMGWSGTSFTDMWSLRRLTNEDWKEWAWYSYREPQEHPQLFGRRIERETPPSWVSVPDARAGEGYVETAAYGWPLRVVRCRGAFLSVAGDSSSFKRGASDGLGNFDNPWVASPAWGIAWKPIWPNLLASAALYGTVMWMSVAMVGAVRRVLRRQRGSCAACGYDLRGLGAGMCPECGAAQRLASSSSQRA